MNKKPRDHSHHDGTNGLSEVEPPIRIELCTGASRKRSMDEALALSVRVTNLSEEPIWMVGVVPGSEGSRYPHYIVEIDGPSGPEKRRHPEDLDYVRGLRAKDFVQLVPGQSFDPQGKGFIPIQSLAWFKPAQPGKYRLRLRFDATELDPKMWMGHTQVADQSKIERLIRLVPRVRVWSNTVEIRYSQESAESGLASPT